MKESIKIEAYIEDADEVAGLELEFLDEQCLTINLDGKELCAVDWIGEFRPALERALELWPAVEVVPGEGR